jgi:PhzF family phenazine biosynthesis protein
MRIKLYQVDAFTDRLFAGNPAAVCPLDRWLDDSSLQAIAEENNLSETAFFVPTARGFHLRWFTPVREVDLCGHATLASAHVLFRHLRFESASILFETRSGDLIVERQGKWLVMDFPASVPTPCAAPAALIEGLGLAPREVLAAEDYIAVLESEAAVRSLVPDQSLLGRLDRRGVCVTARGDGVDFVSRFFAPKYGIPEDPVTGSAHCQLTPYWAARLGKSRLAARQVSKRGGDLECRLQGERVLLAGEAVTFMEAEIDLNAPGF